MNLQESIRRILREETKSGKYTRGLEIITNVLKKEDFVCDIKVKYYGKSGTYEVIVKIDKKEMETNFEKLSIWYAEKLIKEYLSDLRKKVEKEIKDFLPVKVFVYIDQFSCNKKLNESEDKKSRLLSNIEEDGLYQVMQDTGLTLKQIKSKIGEIPREVFERYVKDFLEKDEMGWANLSIQISPNKIIDSFYLSDGVVTIELNEVDSRGRVVPGSFERLSALSYEEIFSLVNEMSQISDHFLDYM